MDAVTLANRHTTAELVAMAREVRADPANQNEPGSSFYLYTKKARKKLEEITWAITYQLKKEDA